MSMMKRGDEVDDDFIQENHFMLRSIQKLNWGVEKRPNKSQNVEKDRKSLKKYHAWEQKVPEKCLLRYIWILQSEVDFRFLTIPRVNHSFGSPFLSFG